MMDKYFQKYSEYISGDKKRLIESGYVEGDESYLYSHMINYPFTSDLSSIWDFYDSHTSDTPCHVLITSGSFAPMHDGHIELATKAIKTVQASTGDDVIGCWYSIDHDNYVNGKKGVIEYSTMERINHSEKLISSNSKLHIDYWSALYSPTDVNFTTVYERFQNYIQYYFPNHNIKLWYVVGGDHLAFLNAFSEFGRGVAIARGGYNNSVDIVSPDALKNCLISDQVTIELSSTMIRNNLNLLKNTHKETHNNDDNNSKNNKTLSIVPSSINSPKINNNEECPDKYFVRNDVTPALAGTLLDAHLSNDEISTIYPTVCSILQKYLPFGIKVQENIFTIPETSKTIETISLDPFTIGNYNFHVTRTFNAFSGQYCELYHSSRIEHDSLETQLKDFPRGSFRLFDDDIITGKTVKYVSEFLAKNGVEIESYHSLTNVPSAFDVVDCRDFIIGSRYGGLTVSYNGQHYRAPYMFPYVNLNSRARISSKNVLNLALDLWMYNVQLFKGSRITIKDLDYSIFEQLGFNGDISVEELCLFHYRLIFNILKTISKN